MYISISQCRLKYRNFLCIYHSSDLLYPFPNFLLFFRKRLGYIYIKKDNTLAGYQLSRTTFVLCYKAECINHKFKHKFCSFMYFHAQPINIIHWGFHHHKNAFISKPIIHLCNIQITRFTLSGGSKITLLVVELRSKN